MSEHQLGDGSIPGKPGFGVYVHLPFCATRCDYCTFATWTDKADLIESYVAACCAEIAAAKCSGQLPIADTIFLGGGTPSLVPPDLLVQLIETIERASDAEITVECNPESTTPTLLKALRSVGVNRISLGVQSLVPHVLAGLGRTHSPGSVIDAVAAIDAAGFPTFNVDLIYGGAGESDDDWHTSVEKVLTLQSPPPHISAYALTVEAGTPLAKDPSRHPDDDRQATRYAMANKEFARAGMSWYEISNWARPGHECRHNASCWRGGEYLGIGCAAHSHIAGRRFFNVTSPERYVARIAAGQSAEAGSEQLPERDRYLEQLELSLRTRDGVPLDALPLDGSLVGLIEENEQRLILTERGRLLANEVALRLRIPNLESHCHHAP